MGLYIPHSGVAYYSLSRGCILSHFFVRFVYCLLWSCILLHFVWSLYIASFEVVYCSSFEVVYCSNPYRDCLLPHGGCITAPPPLPDRQVFTLPLLLNFILGLRVVYRFTSYRGCALPHPYSYSEIDRKIDR